MKEFETCQACKGMREHVRCPVCDMTGAEIRKARVQALVRLTEDKE